MKSSNVKIIVVFFVGMIFGGLSTAVFWSSVGIVAQTELIAANSALTVALSELSTEKEMNIQLTRTLTAKAVVVENASLFFEEKETQIKLRIDVLESKLIKQNNQWRKIKNSYETNLADLNLELNNMKQESSKANIFYAERYRLTKVINELNENIINTRHKAELSQKACVEFNNGNSSNWVSEDDCNSYTLFKEESTVLIDEFNGVSALLDKVNRQLIAISKKAEPTHNKITTP